MFQQVAHGQMAITRGLQVISMILDAAKDKPINNAEFVYLSAYKITQKAIDEYGYETEGDKKKIHFDSQQDFIFKINETMYIFVLFNLIKNALYYLKTHPKSEISIRLEKAENVNRVFVKDTGPGISSDNRKKLFDSFFSVGKKGGTGLGLSYCKRVMQGFEGDIICDSVEGEYTEFVLTFPQVDDTAFNAYKDTIIVDAKPLFAGKRLLLVDDEQINRTITKKYLLPLEVHIDEAANGKQAYDLTQKHPYDLIIMDINMPVMNGLQATEAIRSSQVNNNTIIVAHTSEPPYVAKVKTEKVGMQGMVNKPCTQTELILALQQCLAQQNTTIQSKALDFSGKTVIIADDNPTNRMVAKAILNHYGMTTVDAQNGQDVVDILNTQPCDLILMDIQMPGMDGLVATQFIRQSHEHYNTIPIIAVSGNSDEQEAQAALNIGMNDYLVKPIDKTLLKQALEKQLLKPQTTAV